MLFSNQKNQPSVHWQPPKVEMYAQSSRDKERTFFISTFYPPSPVPTYTLPPFPLLLLQLTLSFSSLSSSASNLHTSSPSPPPPPTCLLFVLQLLFQHSDTCPQLVALLFLLVVGGVQQSILLPYSSELLTK